MILFAEKVLKLIKYNRFLRLLENFVFVFKCLLPESCFSDL